MSSVPKKADKLNLSLTLCSWNIVKISKHAHGLVQDCDLSIANALEIFCLAINMFPHFKLWKSSA